MSRQNRHPIRQAAKGLAASWRGLTAAFESAPAGYAEVRAAS